MKTTPPVYHQHDKTLTADRCKPLIRAVQQNKVSLVTLAREGYPGQPLAKNELPGVLSVGYWDAIGPQDWGLDTHCNEGIELTYLETGHIAFTVEQQSHQLIPDCLTIARPWQPHSLGDPYIGPGRLHWIILDVDVRRPHQAWSWPEWFILTPQDRQQLTRLLSQNETPIWQADGRIAACFQQMAEVIQHPSPSMRISRMVILINDLFISVYDMLTSRRITLQPELTSTQRTVELFLNNLRRDPHLLAHPWTVPAMARHCDLGITHFISLCRRITNLTPMQYLNFQRVSIAADMLRRQPDLTITQVAMACGFNTSQYFATVFKRFFGHSPRHLRPVRQ